MKQSYNKSLAGPLPVASQAGLSGLTLFKRGRTKELYDLEETLLVVHTDRVAGGPGSDERIIPGKGQVVNQMSAYWFQRLREVFPNHLIAAGAAGFASLEALYGKVVAEKLRSAALHLYFKAWKIARYRGILIAESSFEFGLHEGALLLIDDCITQYTSRFWSLESYKPGRALPVLADAGLLSRLRGRVDR